MDAMKLLMPACEPTVVRGLLNEKHQLPMLTLLLLSFVFEMKIRTILCCGWQEWIDYTPWLIRFDKLTFESVTNPDGALTGA